MPCSLVKVNRCFGGTYHLYLQGQIVGPARSQYEARSSACSSSVTSVDFHWTTRRYILDRKIELFKIIHLRVAKNAANILYQLRDIASHAGLCAMELLPNHLTRHLHTSTSVPIKQMTLQVSATTGFPCVAEKHDLPHTQST
jgi:succinylglutamate desuccinylase